MTSRDRVRELYAAVVVGFGTGVLWAGYDVPWLIGALVGLAVAVYLLTETDDGPLP